MTSDETFNLAFERIAQSILTRSEKSDMPIIHISAHGGEDGIELTDGDVIYWEKLNRLLTELHAKIGPLNFPPPLPQNLPKVLVCLSSCSAFKGFAENQPPTGVIQAIVGAADDVGWCEALIAFSTFYYQTLILKSDYSSAVVAMNLAAGAFRNGEPTYRFIRTHDLPSKDLWDEFAKQISSDHKHLDE